MTNAIDDGEKATTITNKLHKIYIYTHTYSTNRIASQPWHSETGVQTLLAHLLGLQRHRVETPPPTILVRKRRHPRKLLRISLSSSRTFSSRCKRGFPRWGTLSLEKWTIWDDEWMIWNRVSRIQWRVLLQVLFSWVCRAFLTSTIFNQQTTAIQINGCLFFSRYQ